jgi:hypothetical protein
VAGPEAVQVRMTIKRERKLRQIISEGTSPQRLVLRARIILAAAAGDPNAKIARDLGCSETIVREWRKRFAGAGHPRHLRPAPFRAAGDARPQRAAAHRLDGHVGPAGRGIMLVAGLHRPSPARTRPGGVPVHRGPGPGRGQDPSAQGPRLAEPRLRSRLLGRAGAVCRLYLHPEPGTA